MVAAIRQNVTVQPGGLIEVRSPELMPGARAEVIVLLERSAADQAARAALLQISQVLLVGRRPRATKVPRRGNASADMPAPFAATLPTDLLTRRLIATWRGIMADHAAQVLPLKLGA